LSGEKFLLDKARDMGDRLLKAFTNSHGIPYNTINLATGQYSNPGWTNGYSMLAEFGTIQLEFRGLSQLTGDQKYDRAATRVMDVMETKQRPDGLFVTFMHPETLQLGEEHITFGAYGDSFFEYLLKQWLLTGKKEDRYRRMYDKAMDGLKNKLWHHSTPSNFGYISEWRNGGPVHKMDHLVCFAGGMLGLGASGNTYNEHMKMAKELTKTCFQIYQITPTKLSPETVNFQQNGAGINHFI
jgi:hypothetical protein